jgi:DNA-binding MarR family transcriptional regulator
VRNPDQRTRMEGLPEALSRAERSVTARLAAALEPEGCSVEQWRILLLLGDGLGHTMSELAEFALVPAPSLTRLIDRMTTDGLVHRTVDARDRRRVLVHLTARGVDLQGRAARRVEDQQRALLADADPDGVQRLLDLLDVLGRVR